MRFGIAQVKQRHPDILEMPTRRVVAHQLNHEVVPFIVADAREQRLDRAQWPFQHLQKLVTIKNQNAADLHLRITRLRLPYYRRKARLVDIPSRPATINQGR